MSIQQMAHLIQNAAMNAFGEPVTLLRSGGVSHALTGIFSSPTIEMAQGQIVQEFTPGPRVELRQSELAAKGIVLAPSDRMVVRGKTHRISKCPDDGQGGLIAFLEEVGS